MQETQLWLEAWKRELEEKKKNKSNTEELRGQHPAKTSYPGYHQALSKLLQIF